MPSGDKSKYTGKQVCQAKVTRRAACRSPGPSATPGGR